MTPQAKALRSAVAAAVGPGKVDAALRAVVEELDLESWKMRDATAPEHWLRALATLLEASGADR